MTVRSLWADGRLYDVTGEGCGGEGAVRGVEGPSERLRDAVLPFALCNDARLKAELPVLGSRGLGAVTGFVVGSVSQRLIARSARPVVLVRARQGLGDEHLPAPDGISPEEIPRTPYRDVVLGLDTARPCDDLIEYAFAAAGRSGARVLAGQPPWNGDRSRRGRAIGPHSSGPQGERPGDRRRGGGRVLRLPRGHGSRVPGDRSARQLGAA
ncbi:universal stress protein [Streptomyces scabiei]|uniref:universal stress protein n=1 Tax=Streptomyces scabiei TaxID=1930 RepID=UPI000B00D95F|nr:universal stress protein [Streptomyces scabiei]